MDITIESGGNTTVQLESGGATSINIDQSETIDMNIAVDPSPDIIIEQGGTLAVDVSTTASAPYIYITDNADTDPVIATLPNGTLIFQRTP